jgi:hypothetical protein
MKSIYTGHWFPSEIISHAIWLYHAFTFSFRDVEDLIAERGIIVTEVFSLGSMAPKVEAAVQFVRQGGKRQSLFPSRTWKPQWQERQRQRSFFSICAQLLRISPMRE